MIFSDIIYVQVFTNRMEWTNFSTSMTGSVHANFSSERLKLHDFDLAEKELESSLQETVVKYYLKRFLTLIMHQPGDENKLSPLELRALREVGYSAGASMVYVWQGHNLVAADIQNKVYKSSQASTWAGKP